MRIDKDGERLQQTNSAAVNMLTVRVTMTEGVTR